MTERRFHMKRGNSDRNTTEFTGGGFFLCAERLPVFFDVPSECQELDLVLSSEKDEDSYGVRQEDCDDAYLRFEGEERREYVCSSLGYAVRNFQVDVGQGQKVPEWVYLSLEFESEEEEEEVVKEEVVERRYLMQVPQDSSDFYLFKYLNDWSGSMRFGLCRDRIRDYFDLPLKNCTDQVMVLSANSCEDSYPVKKSMDNNISVMEDTGIEEVLVDGSMQEEIEAFRQSIGTNQEWVYLSLEDPEEE